MNETREFPLRRVADRAAGLTRDQLHVLRDEVDAQLAATYRDQIAGLESAVAELRADKRMLESLGASNVKRLADMAAAARRPNLVVKAAIVNRDGLILLARRDAAKDGPEAAGKLELPGGRVEFGETPEAALVRELREELDLDVRVDDMSSKPYTSIRKDATGRERHSLVLAFRCYDSEERLQALKPKPGIHSELLWVYPCNIAPGDADLLTGTFELTTGFEFQGLFSGHKWSNE